MANQSESNLSSTQPPSLGRSAWTRLFPMLGLVALMLVSLWAPKSEARLDPYYLLRGLSAGSVKPRILFVLDTSGSMTWRATSQNECANLASCENTTATNRSRINTAREAVRTVVSTVGGIANFSLMTFGQVPPPDRNSRIPSTCTQCSQYIYECTDYWDPDPRWCESTPHQCSVPWQWANPPGPNNAYWYCPTDPTEFCGDCRTGECDACDFDTTCTATTEKRFQRESRMNHSGWGIGSQTKNYFYEICGTNRPFPYLRWDDLGHGTTGGGKVNSNGQTDMPTSPIANVTTNTVSGVAANEGREVQWFPQFMGVRARLDSTNDPSQDILLHTFGDFGTPNNGADGNPANDTVSADQLNNVWGQDFYYWPYVDGFVGYGAWVDNDDDRVGIALDASGASLYAPFYLEGAQSQAVGTRGPATLADARQQVEWLTGDQKDGGVDAVGGTPWTDVIGNNTTSGSVNTNNSAFSHSTVSSYLRMVTQLHPEDSCLPTAAILLTDGDPNCGGCSNLYTYIARLRRNLGVNVYAVGFTLSSTKLNRMACAGAGQYPNGSNNTCWGTPPGGWDTCRTGAAAGCSYVANNAATLAATLRGIVSGLVELDISSGTGASANESGVGAAGVAGEGDVKQTQILASTKYPEWRGSVTRDYCEDTSQTYCQPGPFDFSEYDFQGAGTTSCGEDRQWDAAVCLAERDWDSRDIYINTPANAVMPIWSGGSGGTSTTAFRNAVTAEFGGGTYSTTEMDEMAKFLMGFGWKDGYKLQGLANSAPSVIRRIPKHQPDFKPSVGIRDPHCAGRLLDFGEEVDGGLVTMAKNAWTTAGMNTSTTPSHFEYQEAVTIGSDVGLIHFFQFNSGNELFAFLPRFHIGTVVEQWDHWKNGADVGQPDSVADHSFGMAATANQGFVFDTAADKWRHIMVMGSGVGSKHYVALDVTHLTPFSTSGAPLEVLWTTQDSGGNSAWTNMQAQLGEGWARPAITFHNATTVNAKVEGRVVLSSGYPTGTPTGTQGRYMAVLDAVTGEVLDNFSVPTPPLPTAADGPYDAGYGQVSDVAVASYCTSRYWGEAQEAYVNDPAGRLFRVDLKDGLAHARDFGAAPSGADRLLTPVRTFSACQGTTRPCAITGAKSDAFVYSPAVAALDRIDSAPGDTIRENQLLVAMNSGSIFDDSTDGGDSTNDFNSSIYLMVDNHDGNDRGGFDIPAGEPKMAAGAHASYFRAALTDMQRTRVFTPYPGYVGTPLTDTGYFNKGTRPVGSPLIRVTRGSTGGAVIDDVEFYYVEYTVYEPPSDACDIRFQDASSGIWYPDAGSTYKIRLRLPVDTTGGFDFQNGAGTAYTGGGFSAAGLEMLAPEQDTSGDCADGVCGAAGGSPSVAPCDPNDDPLSEQARSTRGMGYAEIRGFSPFE